MCLFRLKRNLLVNTRWKECGCCLFSMCLLCCLNQIGKYRVLHHGQEHIITWRSYWHPTGRQQMSKCSKLVMEWNTYSSAIGNHKWWYGASRDERAEEKNSSKGIAPPRLTKYAANNMLERRRGPWKLGGWLLPELWSYETPNTTHILTR